MTQDARKVLAIDPGPERSAWLLLYDGRPEISDTCANATLLRWLRERIATAAGPTANAIVIERVQSFGMAVGAEVFETVYWSGRFAEAAQPLPVYRIGRKAIVTHLCGSARAKDTNVRQALLDRFGGKDAAVGRKAAPGPLYGVHGDVWSALAVAVAFSEGVR